MRFTSREALRILDLADIWATRTGNTVRLVSANDHVHTPGSAHYAGRAVDLHSSNLDGLAAALRGLGYKVLWKVPGHFTHVHVQEPVPAGIAASVAVHALRPAAALAINAGGH